MSVLTSASPAEYLHHEHATLARQWWVFFVLGLVSVVVGFVALGSVVVATMASMVVFGVLLLIQGVTEVIHAVMVRNLKGFAIHLLSAALYLIVGLFMLEDPIRAAAVITLLLAAAFFVGGVLRIIIALVHRFPAWPWVALHGVVDLVLGILIFREWPASSLWVIGMFIGIDLILNGWSWMILALGVRNYSQTQSSPAGP
jgi:uncharacterized membrane protein HdeD (DUF308 family)